MNYKLIALVLTLASIASINATLTCKNPSGKSVDWFIALKMPTGVDGKGVKFAYLDADSYSSFKYYDDINSAKNSPLILTAD
mmetsp:Transcript_137156/g.194061  ORF Transcript_137156/g.194061 Transcript_137156/m.194061 type:complete len:82 (-) Transcript_137156:825-1070(-)